MERRSSLVVFKEKGFVKIIMKVVQNYSEEVWFEWVCVGISSIVGSFLLDYF